MAPPADVPNPDGRNCDHDGFAFNFTQLGVRVPVLVISPWIDALTVEHAPEDPSKYYSHSSVLATLRELFPTMPREPMSKREARAQSFAHLFTARDSPRTDCPTELGTRDPLAYKLWRQAEETDSTLHNVKQALAATPAGLIDSAAMTDLQQSIVRVCAMLLNDDKVLDEENSPEGMPKTTAKAALYCLQQLERFARKSRLQEPL